MTREEMREALFRALDEMDAEEVRRRVAADIDVDRSYRPIEIQEGKMAKYTPIPDGLLAADKSKLCQPGRQGTWEKSRDWSKLIGLP